MKRIIFLILLSSCGSLPSAEEQVKAQQTILRSVIKENQMKKFTETEISIMIFLLRQEIGRFNMLKSWEITEEEEVQKKACIKLLKKVEAL